MVHSFDKEIATKYGLHEAIILQSIAYWVEKNKANEKHFYDGSYWTYNSVRAFVELFPYLSDKQIRNALKHLETEGLIKTGNYNKLPYDRTKWYALTPAGESLCLLRNPHLPFGESPFSQKGEPIPVIEPVIEPVNTPKAPRGGARAKEITDLFCSICTGLPKPKTMPDSRRKAILAADKEITAAGGWEQFFQLVANSKFLNGDNDRHWIASFDWLLKPANRTKVLEGTYGNRAEKPVEKDYTEEWWNE